jgi:AN1-type zinc finger protein 1
MANSNRNLDDKKSPTAWDTDKTYRLMTELAIDTGVGSASEQYGARCHYEYCHQLSFLPSLCLSCNQKFCDEHRTEDAHRCPHKGAWGERRRQTALNKHSIGEGRPVRDVGGDMTNKKCAANGCSTVANALVPFTHCSTCRQNYCLKHRLQEEHDCAAKTPVGARTAAEKQLLLDRLGVWRKKFFPQETQSGSSSNSSGTASKLKGLMGGKKKPASEAAQSFASLALLKKEAKGDAKVPPEKRVYLQVFAVPDVPQDKSIEGKFYYSKEWVIGRLLDAAARSLQIENLNNQSSNAKNKLAIFNLDTGLFLEMNQKVGATLNNGNRIAIMRGVMAT